MKQKKWPVWLLGFFIIAVVLVVGLYMSRLYGNPLVKWQTASQMRDYLRLNYPHLPDAQLGEVKYNFKTNAYSAEVLTDSPDTRFEIQRRGDELSDDYAFRVTSGQNTLIRLWQSAGEDIKQLLADKGDFSVYIDLQDPPPEFAIDTPYERGLIKPGKLSLSQVSDLISDQGVEPELIPRLAELIPEVFDTLERAGFMIEALDINSHTPNHQHQYQVFNISREQAMAPDLADRLRQLEQAFYDDPAAAYSSPDMRVIIQ